MKRSKYKSMPHPLSLLWMITVSGVVLLLTLAGILSIFIVIQGSERSMLTQHSPSVLVRDRQGYYLDDIENDRQLFGFWNIPGPVPRVVKLSLLGAEDRNFYKHQGVDFKAIVRAIFQNTAARERVSGASTIPMQVVRMEHPAPRTVWNKMIESYAAYRLIKKYGHEAILRHYLKIVPFGNRYHGIAYASEKYFNKPVQDLSLAESCLLMAIPQQPNSMDLFTLKGRYLAMARAIRILDALVEYEMIAQKDHEMALEELSLMPLFVKEERPLPAMHYILTLREKIKDSPVSNIIYASLDLKLQQKMGAYLKRYVDNRHWRGVGNAAFMLSDKQTGEILVYLGSADYNNKEYKGSIDYCQVPRSSGSVLKPFIYALGMMERGFNGSTVLSDTSMYLSSAYRVYSPQNSDRRFEGPVLYRYALANSRNVPAVQLVNEIGVQVTFDFLKSLNLISSKKNSDYFGLSMAIGGLYVRLYDLMGAYGMLANDGRQYDLQWFRVEEGDEKAKPAHQIIPADISRMISLFISDPIARTPTFKRKGSLEYPFAVAIKTGTSQGFRDAWTLAYTHKYVMGAWTGDADNARMRRLGGSSSSAYILRYAMWNVHANEMNGLGNIGFRPPQGYISREICKVSGKLATPHTAAYITEWFKPGTEPTEYSDVFRKIIVDSRTGQYADKQTPPHFQQSRIVAFLDQKYADWAHHNGITLAPVRNVLGAQKTLALDDYKIVITEPAADLKFLINPSRPREYQSIALKANVKPALEQVVWYHNGRPLEVVGYPYTLRWTLQPGVHSFQVRSAHAPVESKIIHITVE